MRVKNFISALVTACAVFSADATIVPDPTGVWHVPSAPGTGVSIVQQGDTLFVAIFDYDEQQRPTWFVASNVKWNGIVLDPTGWMPHVGDLYRTRGGWFGQPFDPAASGLERVGTVSMYQTGSSIERNLSLAFTVSGRTSNRVLSPLTFGGELLRFTGTFQTMSTTVGIPQATCPGESGRQGMMTSSLAANGVVTVVLANLPGGFTCTSQGAYESSGSRGRYRGNLQCNGSTAGTIELDDIAALENGFLAKFKITSGACTNAGTMSGLRVLPTL